MNDFSRHLRSNPESSWPTIDFVDKFNTAMGISGVNDDEDSYETIDDPYELPSSLDEETQDDDTVQPK